MHEKSRGKLEVCPKVPLGCKDDLSRAYTPGVAEPCRRIAKDPEDLYRYTIKGNSVAVVSDGSAVLGLGNIGADASIPVMEGKAVLFKRFAGIDAFPICIDTQDVDKVVETVRLISPVFGGINLEDIKAPQCFEVESRLQDLGIPVMHDDQHGTAVVTLAAVMNALKVKGLPMEDAKVVINGAGAAGTAIAKLLIGSGLRDCIVCDSKGIISDDRPDIGSVPYKKELASITNPKGISGTLSDAMSKADIFLGVSVRDIVTPDMVRSMNKDPVIIAMANPDPEIRPELAKDAGALIVATGRSDYPNQVNNVLGFPGIFRGALDVRATRITEIMKIAAAKALADIVEDPTPDEILPYALDERVVERVSKAVGEAWLAEND